MIKKIHELSVICGLKVSIVCTDFEKSCFTYCNDPRLEPSLETIFKGTNKPLWLTNFLPSEVKILKGKN